MRISCRLPSLKTFQVFRAQSAIDAEASVRIHALDAALRGIDGVEAVSLYGH